MTSGGPTDQLYHDADGEVALETPGRRPRLLASLSWAALSVGVAGLLTAGYLALVARSLPATEYGWFGAFWSVALIVGFGLFLPIEQELARLVHLRGRTAPLPRGAGRAVAGVTALGLAAVLAGWPLLRPALGGSTALVAALAVVCLASGAQFLLRGLLLGRGAVRVHGAVVLLDAALRVAGAAAVAAWIQPASAAGFGWTLVAALLLAHVPLLAWITRPAAVPVPVPPADDRRVRLRVIASLTVGALCAQVLLNAAPVLVAGAAGPGEQVLAAQFVACFTLTRLPLFLAVPVQGVLIPGLVRVTADRRGARSLVAPLAGGVVLLCGAAALLGWLAGPPLVGLLFGARYALPGADLALLAVGTALYLGLLVTTQALVAAARHRGVALVWAAGLAAAAVVFAAVPGLVARAGLALVAGCAVALGAGLLLLAGRTAPAPTPLGGPR
ncbi:lipopolysaccharide biosynthesis protein [Geodermatophilus ruber]|uniref:Membrane protein involved in the export of O-antigen and teichoic acid n=1 Tax=Geodermatophilus ruber TaxID=504800 RepID=A0A1I4L7Z5_9ACTN|nr:hypothetical protein [Geodermatophilus ruber]SFL87104.1 Membrane protein involved in the export of O-antigen and teichoic acid [Geodermatophilus ruber]